MGIFKQLIHIISFFTKIAILHYQSANSTYFCTMVVQYIFLYKWATPINLIIKFAENTALPTKNPGYYTIICLQKVVPIGTFIA
ncbi:hypothetical protein D0T60_09735 [Bacteroides sp. 224]|nr:hypothetical protein [Bacteroides sp. 224]